MDTTGESQWHESAGARLLLPSLLSVARSFPLFEARATTSELLIVVTVTSCPAHRESFASQLAHPPRSDEFTRIDVLRQGPVLSPFPGSELAIQLNQLDDSEPPVSYYWARMLNLEASGAVAFFRAQGVTPFREAEAMWLRVMESFRWNSAEGIVLTPESSQAAPAKKPTRRKVPPSQLMRLPAKLEYLQPVLDHLASLPPEEVNEDYDLSVLESLLRQRVASLSFSRAEQRLAGDSRALRQWIDRDEARTAAELVWGVLYSFQFALGGEHE